MNVDRREQSPNYETYLLNIRNRLSDYYKDIGEQSFRDTPFDEIHNQALKLSRQADAELYGEALRADLKKWIWEEALLKGENEMRSGRL